MYSYVYRYVGNLGNVSRQMYNYINIIDNWCHISWRTTARYFRRRGVLAFHVVGRYDTAERCLQACMKAAGINKLLDTYQRIIQAIQEYVFLVVLE